jgi:hypothetical protein
LGVFARGVISPQPIFVGTQWTQLLFDSIEWDTYGSLQYGGRFYAPFRGTYALEAHLLFQQVPPNSYIGLRVVRNGGYPEVERSIVLTGPPATNASAEISTLALLSPGESLHVEIRINSPGFLLQVESGPPSSSLVIAGVGASDWPTQ